MKKMRRRLWAVKDKSGVNIYQYQDEPDLYFVDLIAKDKSGHTLSPVVTLPTGVSDFFEKMPEQELVEISVKAINGSTTSK